jgi:tyrosinase
LPRFSLPNQAITMLFSYTTAVALLATSYVAAKPTPARDTHVVPRAVDDGLDKLAELAQAAYEQAEEEASTDALTKRNNLCSWSNVKIRREWGSLSAKQRIEYTNAVKCLQSKPARTPASAAPGAKTRFDDFVATHMNQTNFIHFTGNFLSWHRYYTWVYEKALQEECGYTGTQPYWDWPKTAVTGLKASPIFDGSATSMSGDGAFIPGQPDLLLTGGNPDLDPIVLPPGTGGGCITSGPFKDMKVNLGPAALDLPGGAIQQLPVTPEGALAYNPRCLKRSLTDYANSHYSNASATVSNILKPQNVWDFQMQMQGEPGTGTFGIHGGGHYSLGGDPGRDGFVSPGDPAFYLHHAQIDRVWWMWQMLSPVERQYGDIALSGTNTFLNSPPSANTTFDDFVQFDYAAGPPTKIRDLMSTLAGPFCYVYL